MEFTPRDVARLRLSHRLSELSDRCRSAVAAPGHDDPDGLRSVVEEIGADAARLRDDLDAYQRGSTVDGVYDPAGLASALDTWFVRRAQVEPMAQFADPVSRMLDGGVETDPSCLVCRRHRRDPVPNWADHVDPDAGWLYEDELFRVGPGPSAVWPAGTLLVETRRHVLDIARFTPGEAAGIGPVVQRFIEPIKVATGAPRVHVWCCMEGAPHFHLWLVPRRPGLDAGRTFVGDPGYCTPAEAAEVAGRIRAELRVAAS